ncbi:GNAT family N-acetyltransferase [Pseudonocardia sp. TRM90224]|uniref:GNAT family N-acetyltransferase n=1 Tax=Pseudonocardia sp. TRM90224 TaxID=2812678 RepID=UPI001E519FA2|nr:GNAT family N-acetyltransferase [Pseudonocardia sp. TRM90224]
MNKPNVRLATEADGAAIFAMRRAREDWLAARGIRQWPIGMVDVEHVAAQVLAGQWWLLAPGGELQAAMRVLWSDEAFWDDTPGTAVYVHGLMVGPGHSGKGLGRRMLDAAGRMGLDAGAEFFRLDCAADNERLKTIYRSYGFTEVGRKELPGFSAALMQLPLTTPDPRHPPSPPRGVRKATFLQ